MAKFTKILKSQVETLNAEQLGTSFSLNGLTIKNRSTNGYYFDIIGGEYNTVIARVFVGDSEKEAKASLWLTIKLLNVLLNNKNKLLDNKYYKDMVEVYGKKIYRFQNKYFTLTLNNTIIQLYHGYL